MSSAMMTRMFGFCCCANAGAPAVVAAAAKASSPDQMFFAKPIIHSSGFLNALEAAYAMLLEGLHQARPPVENASSCFPVKQPALSARLLSLQCYRGYIRHSL